MMGNDMWEIYPGEFAGFVIMVKIALSAGCGAHFLLGLLDSWSLAWFGAVACRSCFSLLEGFDWLWLLWFDYVWSPFG